ncbi:hypothetical protein CD110_04350 [Staphylococcus casei]|nr:hypothetical protein CD110_04350 [Staphylococcus casei]PTI79595.1 hypothetical protein BU064_04835 [Staphylococcus succinus]
MILIWLLTIMMLTVLTKWITNHLLKKQWVFIAQIVVTIFCIIQFIFVYFLVKALMNYIVQGLNVFYH